jgi:aspartate aminotransferase
MPPLTRAGNQMPTLPNHLSGLQGQPMFQILAECNRLEGEGQYIRHFELGDPDFDTPSQITEAAINSLQSGITHYQPARGKQSLIEAIRATTKKSRGFIPDAEQITVTTGANAGIFCSLQAIAEPGSEVLLPDPYFPSYIAAAALCGINCKYYRLDAACGFQPDIDHLSSLVNENTRAILINSPANPTGTVWTEQNIREVFEIAEVQDLYLVSDEVYARMVFGNGCEFLSPSIWDHCKKRTIVINGFSKAFAMTGWRVGAAIAPAEVSRKITLISESIVSCVPGFIQDAAEKALRSSKEVTSEMYKAFRKKQEMLQQQFEQSSFMNCDIPDGAMYIFPSIKQITEDCESFAFHLLKTEGVACVPGVYFGANGKGYLRFSCAGKESDIIGLDDLLVSAANSFRG